MKSGLQSPSVVKLKGNFLFYSKIFLVIFKLFDCFFLKLDSSSKVEVNVKLMKDIIKKITKKKKLLSMKYV